MTIHTPKTQPVIRAYQLQQQIERMQQHYHFAVKIESKKLLLIVDWVSSRSMYVRRTCEINACLLDDEPPLFND